MEVVIFFIGLIVGGVAFLKIKNKQINKGTSKILAYIYGLLMFMVSFIFVLGVGSAFVDKPKIKQSQKQQQLKILSVSDYKYTMKNKQSVSIMLGISKDNYFDITVHRAKIKQGIKLQKNKDNYIGSIDCEANFDKKHYVFLKKDNLSSYINFDVVKIDYAKKQAILVVSAKLHNPNDNNEIELKEQQLIISDKLFDNLTKNIQ